METWRLRLHRYPGYTNVNTLLISNFVPFKALFPSVTGFRVRSTMFISGYVWKNGTTSLSNIAVKETSYFDTFVVSMTTVVQPMSQVIQPLNSLTCAPPSPRTNKKLLCSLLHCNCCLQSKSHDTNWGGSPITICLHYRNQFTLTVTKKNITKNNAGMDLRIEPVDRNTSNWEETTCAKNLLLPPILKTRTQ